MAHHIALLGDSIFDNRSYTGGEPDVVTHLRQLLPPPWRATLCAVDGSTAADLGSQLTSVPEDADQLVISVGGNDALLNADLLFPMPLASTAEALELFAERVAAFESQYSKAIDRARDLGRRVTTCTVYNGNFGREEGRSARIALMLFNDVILRVAFERRLSAIDLRLICNRPEDYANPIEPSGTGGRKIAAAVARAVGAMGHGSVYSRVFAG